MKVTPKWIGPPRLTIELDPQDAAVFASIVRNTNLYFGLRHGGASLSFIERAEALVKHLDAALVDAGALPPNPRKD